MRRWDANGDYVRKFVPELRNMNKKYIYEPHKAPLPDQKQAGVLIRGDGTEIESGGLSVYPKPMFDFNQQRDICLKGMKNAYEVGLYGDDARVLDGSWKQFFPDDAEGPTAGAMGGPGGLMRAEDAEAATPKSSAKRKASQTSPLTPTSKRRERGQRTLDGAFGKNGT